MKLWIGLALSLFACFAVASEGEGEPPLTKIKVAIDQPALERGADTVMTVCLGCHSLKYIRFRELTGLGIAKDKVDGWRGSNPLGTAIASQMPADAALASFGKAPPDLSLMASAREGGASYIYSYLLGYYLTPEGVTGNHYFPATKMPDILGVVGVTDPAQHAALEQKAHDIASFLAWAADPREQERKALGYNVIAYLLLLTFLLYLIKRRVWSRLDRA